MLRYLVPVLLSCVLFLTVSGCRKSGLRCNSLGLSIAIQDELNNLSATSAAYSQNPTPANCNAYRQAYVDYINAIRDWEKCLTSPAERASWQQSLDEAEQNAMDLEC